MYQPVFNISSKQQWQVTLTAFLGVVTSTTPFFARLRYWPLLHLNQRQVAFFSAPKNVTHQTGAQTDDLQIRHPKLYQLIHVSIQPIFKNENLLTFFSSSKNHKKVQKHTVFVFRNFDNQLTFAKVITKVKVIHMQGISMPLFVLTRML